MATAGVQMRDMNYYAEECRSEPATGFQGPAGERPVPNTKPGA